MEEYGVAVSKLFKERENASKIGVVIGKIVSGFPDMKISILNGDSLLYQENLFFCERLLGGYTREVESLGVNLEGFNATAATSTHKLSGGTENDYVYSSINIPKVSIEKSTYTLKYTDTLKIGDLVVVIPTESENSWFVVSKVRQVL